MIRYTHRIKAKPWVRRWMIVTFEFVFALPGYLGQAFKYAAQEASEEADRWDFQK